MKTAISLPDKLFKSAERTAKRLGIPRSRLFARALEEFISRHDKENVTKRLNDVYAAEPVPEQDPLIESGMETLRKATGNDSW